MLGDTNGVRERLCARRLASAALLCLLAPLSVAGPAAAQPYLDYYSVQHADRMTLDWKSFYERANRDTGAVRAQFPHRLGLKYGTHPKQALDLYLPAKLVSNAPVVLFIHGGSFLEGDRSDYGFVARSFLSEGAIVAVMSYRLTGDGVHFPAQLDDVKTAMAWLYAHAAEHGGNPENMILSGHSAGAILAAGAGVDRAWMDEVGMPRDALKAIVGISGKYRLGPGEKLFANYVPDATSERLASPILQIGDPAPLFLLGVGSTETAYLDPTIHFFRTLRDHEICASLYVAADRDHQQILEEFAQQSSPLMADIRPLLQMFRATSP